MNLGLDGKVALITGASRGIGRATALRLAREGCDLALCARGQEALESVAGEVRQLGRQALALIADVGVQSDRERLVETASAEYGRIDLLVSNATNLDVYRDNAPESALWDAHYHVDVLGAVRLTELITPGMRQRGAGAIVYVSSISGKMTLGCEHGYTAMKAALIAAGRTLATELIRDGIRVNVVAPGTLATDDLERMRQVEPERVDALLTSIPGGRFGTAEEVASCIAFLLSDQASWVIGQCLVIDGGQYPGIA